MKLPQPKNEKRRLEVLWQYHVLDTPAEAAFDDLAELAAEICGAPIATITFIDEKRQWFKAKVGLSASETSREISFCAHAILSSELLVIPDATKDKRFAKNPLVTGEPHIRFYAGAPLIDPDGHALGTLCVIDKVPRELNSTQRHALEVFSRHVVALLELRRRSVDKAKPTKDSPSEFQNATFSRLGHSLSGARSPEEAGRIIVEAADQLMGWDACTFDLYSVEEDRLRTVLNQDIVNGKRTNVPPAYENGKPTPRIQNVIKLGGQLILREPPFKIDHGSVAFGDVSRPSASILIVPVRNALKVTGILSIQSYKLHAYKSQDLQTLQTMADLCGGAIERITAEQNLAEERNLLRTLLDRQAAHSKLGQNLSTAASPQEAARVIGETTRELFGWDLFTLDLYFAESNTVQPIVNIDTIDGKMLEVSNTVPIGPPSPLARRIIEKGASLILKKPPLTMLPGALPFGDTSRPSASLMLVPIRNGTNVIGILSNQSYTLNAYTQQDLGALQTMADHCGGALERIRAEEALRTSEVRFHSVWENSVDGMRLTDENGIIVAVNKAFCTLVEMERAELEGQPFTITYASAANPADLLNTYQRRFRDRTVEKFIERKVVFRSGKTAELEGTNSFVDLESKRPMLLGLFRDVTEQKRLETQLRQSQKMDSIGQLAGGIAHDFNNLLTVIQGHTSLLLATEKQGEAADSLQEISLAAERSANLTRQLLTFSRRQIMQRRTLDLKEVVDEMIKMLRRILGEDIVLTVENSSNLPRIHADRGMMEQILLNLAVNSRDAMPRGGELVISTSSVQIDEAYTRQNSDAYLGEFVCLKVRDTGCGITPENLGHIFEPFFTTKEIGKGTGLGLATVYGIVKQHEGWIEVASEVGKGTVFNIYFPRSREASESSAKSRQKKMPRGTETILVVEDEGPLRELVQFLLERQGYKVLEAASGVAAVKVWEKNKDAIDLLLTDLVMPEGMTGGELSKRLLADNPKLKVIFTSGYSADIVGKDFVLRDGLNFLQKPYHPDKLAQTVRDCLDGK